MNLGLENMFSNLGVSIETTVLIIIVIGSLIFMAKKYEIGLIILLITSSLTFMLFYHLEMRYTNHLVVMFMSLIFLALSFYTSRNTAQSTGGLT